MPAPKDPIKYNAWIEAKKKPHSEETKKKISESCIKNKVGFWSKGTSWNKGLQVPEETKLKISSSLKGKKCPHVSESNKNRIISDETRLKRSEIYKKLWEDENFRSRMVTLFTGENNPNWVSDRSKLVTSEKKHLDSRYKEWMLAVKKRDNWKCRINNFDCKGTLESHHILPWRSYPGLRYEINNGITLCQFHHPKKREDEKRLSINFFEILDIKLDDILEGSDLVAGEKKDSTLKV